MADTYEKDLGQKSSLTASDFIRVVGSDNVSYKQSINTVNRTIPLTPVTGLTTEALIDQAYITAHEETSNETPYRRIMNHSFNHSIFGGGRKYLEGYRSSANYGWQKVTGYGNYARIFTRTLNNGTWTEWKETPTRAEVDELKAQISNVHSNITQIANNTTASIDVANGTSGIMFTTGVAASARGIYAWGTTASGGVSGSWLVQASGISADTSTANIIKFTNTSGAYANVISLK